MDAWFQTQLAKANDDFMIGRALQRNAESDRRVDMPLDQLEAVGHKDLERNLAALKEACSKFAPGKILADCIAKEHADKPQGSPLKPRAPN